MPPSSHAWRTKRRSLDVSAPRFRGAPNYSISNPKPPHQLRRVSFYAVHHDEFVDRLRLAMALSASCIGPIIFMSRRSFPSGVMEAQYERAGAPKVSMSRQCERDRLYCFVNVDAPIPFTDGRDDFLPPMFDMLGH